MEVFQVFDRPASQAFYSVAGRLLFVESFDLELRNLIVELFTGWQLTPVSFPDRTPDIQISFSCGETPAGDSRGLNQFEIAEGGKCYTCGPDFYLEFGDSLVHLELEGSLSQSRVSLELRRFPGDAELARVRLLRFVRRCDASDCLICTVRALLSPRAGRAC